MTTWQIAWDLVQIAVGVLMTYGVAIWKGDAVMRRLNERKRLGAWSRLREQIIGHIRATTGPLFASAQLRGRIDRTQGFNPDKWVTHLREILSRAQTRTNDGIVEDADLWNRELDPEAILGATDVGLEYAGRVSRQLGTVLLLYRDSLPERTQQLLAEAVFASELARGAIRPLGVPKHQNDKRGYDIQATTNTRCMVGMVEALLALLRDMSTTSVEMPTRRGY